MEELIVEQAEQIAQLLDEVEEMRERIDTLADDLEAAKVEAEGNRAEYDELRDALDKFFLDQLGTYNPTHLDFIAKGWPVDLARVLM